MSGANQVHRLVGATNGLKTSATKDHPAIDRASYPLVLKLEKTVNHPTLAGNPSLGERFHSLIADSLR